MVYKSRVGDVFVFLSASSWRMGAITADQVLVSPAPGQPNELPFWHGGWWAAPRGWGGRWARSAGKSPQRAGTRLPRGCVVLD